MKQEFLARVEQLNIRHRRRMIWYRIVSVLACITVFITTYALILPAVTMDEDEAATCGMIDHQHTEECYETVIIPGEEYLVCGQDEHMHSDACYDGRGRLICGEREHLHRKTCYDRTEPIEELRLICDLPEHEHDMACFTPAVSVGDYTCGIEYEHTHGESCYENGTLVCSMQEHVHGEACRNYTLSQAAVGGIGVDVIGAQDAFPCNIRNVRLTAENVHSESLMELLKEAVGGEAAEGASMTVLDVSLWNSGKAIEPTGFVTVRLSGMVGENETARVFHLDEQAGTVTEMTAYVDGSDILFETDHFSYYGITVEESVEKGNNLSTDSFGLSYSASWDSVNGLTSAVVTLTNQSEKKDVNVYLCTLALDENGDPVVDSTTEEYSWSTAADATKVNKKTSVDFTVTGFFVGDPLLNETYRYKVSVDKDNYGYSDTFTILNFYDAALPGFSDWLERVYVGEWHETKPDTLAALNDAAAIYDGLPQASIEKSVETKPGGKKVGASVSVDPEDTYCYFWQYLDPTDGLWKDFDGNKTETELHADKIEQIIRNINISSNKLTVRCIAVPEEGVTQTGQGPGAVWSIDPDYRMFATSNELNINPDSAAIEEAIQKINDGLNLDEVTVKGSKNNTKVNLSIGGQIFNEYFYYGYYDPTEANKGNGVARDYNVYSADDPKHVPFYDADSYAEYLGQTYISTVGTEEEKLAAAESVWYKYLYDLFDPGYLSCSNNTSYYTLSPSGKNGFGDGYLGWPKTADAADSFHYQDGGAVDELTYNYTEAGIDYSGFISNVLKSAAAEAAGDTNTQRLYDIEITADGQSKADAPVAIIFQIQTSWQMFDMKHANAIKNQSKTEVGRVGESTELATLYDIKHALLDVVDYMENNLSSKNVVLGITEVRHGNTDSMITTYEGDQVYVSNNYNELRKAIQNWDIFGNCEHVHYGTTALENAVKELSGNLEGWRDFYGHEIDYTDIRKVGIVVGGPTEATAGDNGYLCNLSWSAFTDADFNAVYGIQVNRGTPDSGHTQSQMSWITNSSNYNPTSGKTFKDGVGSSFTKKYDATSREEFYDTIVEIINRERKTGGIDLTAGDKWVEEVVVSDVIEDEFKLDTEEKIVLSTQHKDGHTIISSAIDLKNKTVTDENRNVLPAVFSFSGAWNGEDEITVSFERDMFFEYTITNVIKNSNGEVTGTETTTYTDGHDKVTQTVTITPNSDGTTTVTADYDRLYNTQKAVLDFGIQAKDDYIGSNNVYTNVGTPAAGYSHTGNGGKEVYNVDCYDTPMVNVPILFEVGGGGSKTYVLDDDHPTASEYPWNIAEECSGGQFTFAAVHELLTKYDQINGTLKYTVEETSSNGGYQKSEPAGVVIANGEMTNRDALLDHSLRDTDGINLFTTSEEGTYTFNVSAAFTPDRVDPAYSANFKIDGKTALGVEERRGAVGVTIKTVKKDTTLSYKVRKEWASEHPEIDVIKFRMVGTTETGETFTSETYTLDDSSFWQREVTGLPAVSETGKVYAYSVEEDGIVVEDRTKGAWNASYSKKSDGKWANYDVKFKPYLKLGEDNNPTRVYIKVYYTYGGKNFSSVIRETLDKDGKPTSIYFKKADRDGFPDVTVRVPMLATDGKERAFTAAGETFSVNGISYSTDSENWISMTDAYTAVQVGDDVQVTMRLSVDDDAYKIAKDGFGFTATFALKNGGTVTSDLIPKGNYEIKKGTYTEVTFMLSEISAADLGDLQKLTAYVFKDNTYYNYAGQNLSDKDDKQPKNIPYPDHLLIEHIDLKDVTASAPSYTVEEEFIIRNERGEPEMPSTGGSGMKPYVVLGGTLMCTPLTVGFVLRRKRERRTES